MFSNLGIFGRQKLPMPQPEADVKKAKAFSGRNLEQIKTAAEPVLIRIGTLFDGFLDKLEFNQSKRQKIESQISLLTSNIPKKVVESNKPAEEALKEFALEAIKKAKKLIFENLGKEMKSSFEFHYNSVINSDPIIKDIDNKIRDKLKEIEFLEKEFFTSDFFKMKVIDNVLRSNSFIVVIMKDDKLTNKEKRCKK